MVAASELPITTVREGTTAVDMAEAIFGDGVTVVSANYTGDIDSAGIYTGGDSIAAGATLGDSGIILSSGDVEKYTNTNGQSNQSNSTSTNTTGENNNSLFNDTAGRSTFDAAYLDVDFIAVGNVMTMQFVFASDEYPEFTNSIYQDFVGVWVNGGNVPLTAADQVDLGIGDGDTDPGNINSTDNQNLFLDNTSDAFNTEMDGLTVTLKLTIPVTPGLNSIRIGIADVGDSSYDSSLLIAADSVQTAFVAVDDSANLFQGGSKTLDVLDNDIGSGTLEITHINNVPVDANNPAANSVALPTGQVVTLNTDGTITVSSDGDLENFNFTYTSTNGTLDDTGLVKITTVPCFVAGTTVETEDGPRPIETLRVGDLVLTKDDGFQPVRWIGMRTVQATGDMAPIEFVENALGTHRAIQFSPQHRILIQDALAELLFGEAEVLVAAKNLVNDTSIRRRPGGEVTYVHVLFDAHQVIFTEGVASESFLPGPQTTSLFEEETLAEICRLFPELDPNTGAGYSPAARRTLRRYEADLWRQQARLVA